MYTTVTLFFSTVSLQFHTHTDSIGDEGFRFCDPLMHHFFYFFITAKPAPT
jgi:hypothetical protein